MLLTHVHGNLFDSDQSLAHFIARDFTMKDGIAKEFRRRFGRVPELIAQERHVGQTAILSDGRRSIYYLIGKEHYDDTLTYHSLRLSLISLREAMLVRHERHLSMPRIGSGADRLQWSTVETMLKEIFKDSGIQITIYSD